ncbi:MAG: helix-turn-helix transcriptional regulator [Phycisphaerales bacterium]
MAETFERELMRGSLDLMVLSVLADGANYGYQIQKRVREAGGDMIKLQAGTLYPLLHRLQADGVIKCQWEFANGRKRKWYELTPAGRRRLRDQATQWDHYAACIRQLLTPALTALPAD